MYQQLLDKNKILAVIGLGYVGLPIALEFARKVKVIGFDINAGRVEMMRNNIAGLPRAGLRRALERSLGHGRRPARFA